MSLDFCYPYGTCTTLVAQDKTLNLHSTVFRHGKPLLPLHLLRRLSHSSCSLYFLPSFSRSVSFLSPRLKATHNSRSQFSISADFSIRLRGAAVLTRGTRQLLLVASSCRPPRSHVPTPRYRRTGATISRIEKRWGSPFLSFHLSPSHRASLTFGQPNRVNAGKKAMS